MVQAKTYSVGGPKYIVHYRDNHTGIWNSTLIHTDLKHHINDVMCDPNDSDKVIVVGTGNSLNGSYSLGIHYSIDGGVTFTQSDGDYRTGISLQGASGFSFEEVWYVNSNVIYVCGSKGLILKSIDGGVTFNMCNTGVYLDFTCIHALDEDIVYAGYNTNLILRSIDGGANFSPVYIIPSNISNINKIYADELYLGGIRSRRMSNGDIELFILTNTKLLKSINGGSTWTTVLSGERYRFRHLTWIDDNNLWVFGYGCIYKINNTDTIATYELLYLGTPGEVLHAGHFYSEVQNIFSGYHSHSGDLYISHTNDLSDQTYTDNFGNDSTIFAVWSSTMYTCYTLTPCDPDSTNPSINVTNDLSDYIGQVLTVCGNESIPYDNTDTSVTPSDKNAAPIYKYVNCNNGEITYSRNGVFSMDNKSYYIPSLNGCYTVTVVYNNTQPLVVVDISNLVGYESCETCIEDNTQSPVLPLVGCECYTVSISNNCEGSYTLIEGSYTPFEGECSDCINVVCYKLTNCVTGEIRHISNDLELVLGKYIKFDNCPNSCWYVEEGDDCSSIKEECSTYDIFDTCSLCVGIEEPTVISYNYRTVVPGYNSNTCDINYMEKINCRYSEAIYNNMIKQKYGVNVCCDVDVYKLEIKKKLLDLDMITDSNLC